MSVEDRTLALAGIFQAATLVRQIAVQGLVDQVPFANSIQSVLQINPSTIEEVYGGLAGVHLGLQTLHNQLEDKRRRDLETMRCVLGLMFLERKLIKRKNMILQLQQGIGEAAILAATLSATAPEVIEHLANLYLQTLSTFRYRIQVKGEPRYLNNQNNADRVRALLLAGIRSAVLWQQKGGGRFQFLFSQRKILTHVQSLLQKTE